MFDDISQSSSIETDGNTLFSNEDPYSLSLRITSFDDDKIFTRFCKNCERLIRSSPEYKLWAEYIRTTLGYVKCELTQELHSQVTTEIHHHPISLFTMTKSMILQYIEREKEFCSFDIAIKVIELHYSLDIGFCVLIGSLHEKFHNGYLLLPIDIVRGNYNNFIDKYSKYFDKDDAEIIEKRLEINYENCGYDKGYLWSSDHYQITKV